MSEDLIRLDAVQVVERLARGDVSPLELVDAAIARIEAVDGPLNAMPIRCFERAREHALKLMRGRRTRRAASGWLGGLPIAIKDLNEVAGVRCTYGSTIYADHVPTRSDLLVETLERRGGIVMGKTNTPEFGAGGNTFNDVLGITRNPWNTSRTVGGSSGGAACALASGQVWLAQGSDLGGSLRTPAAFCGVIGLRPSPGRVARGPEPLPFNTLSVDGPMARNPLDAALLLDALAGRHDEDPLSLERPRRSFLAAVRDSRPPRRVAFSPDLGFMPVDPEVARICRAAAERFADMGAQVEEACPDFSGAMDTFQTLRAAGYAAGKAELLRTHREQLKPEVIWNIEQGMALDAARVGAAEIARGRLYHDCAAFFRRYDLLLSPATIVPPFPAEMRWVEEANGRRFDNYVEWMGLACAVTLTSLPALSAPAGFTAGGLPVGLQIIGPPRGEAAVLAAAHRLDEATGFSRRLPVDPHLPR